MLVNTNDFIWQKLGKGTRSELPDEKTVEIEIRPLLCFPPVVLLPVEIVARHGTGWERFRHCLQKHSAPGNVVLFVAQVRR
jgi:hypothetical protein